MRPAATASVSLAKNGTVAHPVIGDVAVGSGLGVKPNVEAMAIDRASWNGSVTTRTEVTPRALSWGATDETFW